MYLIGILIAVEVIASVFAASPAQKSSPGSLHTQAYRTVLGEADSSSDTISNEPTPTDQPTPDQTTSPTDTPSQQELSPTETQPEPSQQEPPSSNIVVPVQIDTSNQKSTNTTSKSNATKENKSTPIQTDLNGSIASLDMAVFPATSEASPSENLSNQTVTEVKNENDQLEKAKSPEEEAGLLTQYATNNIQNINKNLQNNNVDDMAFNALRFSSQIDRSIDTIQQLPQAKAKDFKTKIQGICKNAEYVLRPELLVVPEHMEETFEITRGKCFSLQP